MIQKNRYSLQRVFWVVLSVYLFFSMLALLVILIAPVSNKFSSMEHFLTWRNLLSTCASIVFSTFFYFFSINRFYQMMAEKKETEAWVKNTAISVLMLAAYFTISFFFLKTRKISIGISEREMEEQITSGLLIFSYVFSTLLYMGLALLISYLTVLRDEKKQRKILEAQKLQLEVEKSQANFNFLKAQINPHFLHNTLNFLYAKSLPYSQELSEGILTLSDIMRYALSEGNAKDGKAPLKDEIEHVRNVIKINQLRFSHKLNVDFEVEGVVNGATIIPFVLITLVENAFKHGDLKNTDYPITIRLRVNEKSLYFMCQNKKKTGPKELSTGIGLDNIRKRLDLAYGQDYRFHVKDETDIYTTELTILKL